jgi:hypothetical protein
MIDDPDMENTIKMAIISQLDFSPHFIFNFSNITFRYLAKVIKYWQFSSLQLKSFCIILSLLNPLEEIFIP